MQGRSSPARVPQVRAGPAFEWRKRVGEVSLGPAGLPGSARPDLGPFCAAGTTRQQPVIQRLVQGMGQAALGLAASAALVLGGPAGAEEMQLLRFPASPIPEVFAVQRTLVEAWTIVTEVGGGRYR